MSDDDSQPPEDPTTQPSPFDHITPGSPAQDVADASGSAPEATEPEHMQVRVHLPQRTPIVTYTLIALTVLVFLAQMGSDLLFGADLPAYFGMKIDELMRQGQYWRFLTPVLLHGNLLHIGVNMYSLYALGPGLERHYGHWPFLLLYAVSGITGVAASAIFSDASSLGASTAIFGLLGAFGAFLYLNREVFSGARSALGQVLRVAALNLLIGLSPGIDNWGHLGGLVGGAIVGLLAGPVYAVTGRDAADLYLENQRGIAPLVAASLVTSGLFVAAAIFFL